jgi:hypothetical protein
MQLPVPLETNFSHTIGVSPGIRADDYIGVRGGILNAIYYLNSCQFPDIPSFSARDKGCIYFQDLKAKKATIQANQV